MYRHAVFHWNSYACEDRYQTSSHSEYPHNRASRWSEIASIQIGTKMRMVLVHVTRYTQGNVQNPSFLLQPYSDQNQFILDSCAMCVPAQNNPNWDGSHHVCRTFENPILHALSGISTTPRRQIALRTDIDYVRGEY